MSATRHWIALDGTFSRLLPASPLRHARGRLAHRAAALSDIYLARMLNAIAEPGADQNSLSRRIDELRMTHRELTAALARSWSVDRDQEKRTVEVD
ncbi:MAG TPA: hypothetical protein VFO21_20005 [Vicinamibacterales bacterium]|nr:hypothetical protein [Vicinamibacterales bacterium]